MHASNPKFLLAALCCTLLVSGCGREDPAPQKGSRSAASAKPKEAAAQLETVFASAPVEAKDNANIASEALRVADYEKAVVSLQVIKEQGNLTLDQGMAIHNSMVSLESKLITAIAQGDENAKRAYDLLKKSKRQ